MREQILAEAKGVNGKLLLLEDRIRIERGGFTGRLYEGRGRCELLLHHVRDIELRQALGGLGGYLAFHDDEGREEFDDFCVSFLRHQQPAFEAFAVASRQRRAVLHAALGGDSFQVLPTEKLPDTVFRP